MTVTNTASLERFSRKHADVRRALTEWLDTVNRAEWKSIEDVRRIYPFADGVSVQRSGGKKIVATVFNVKGNRYRLITVISYSLQIVNVAEVLTHAQYSKSDWKGRI